MLEKLIIAGVDVIRLNFSHGNQADHLVKIERVREIFAEKGLSASILLDTRGPEIRTHNFVGGKAKVIKDSTVTITMDEVEGTAERFSVNYPNLINDIEVGSHIKIDDGILDVEVTAIDYDKKEIIARALNTHSITNRRGVNIPFARLSLPYVSDKDRADIEFGCDQNVSFIAASFVRSREDVEEIREILRQKGKEYIKIIAKIENHEGVNNIAEIVEVSDGIMIARGDMGVELPPEEVPIIQKKIINECFKAGKPSITATQMLDSMMRNPTPTRAEVSDVANAIYDGSDAIMLSGETASGEYPLESVMMQATIAGKIEPLLNYYGLAKEAFSYSKKNLSDAISYAIATTADTINAAIIVAMSGNELAAQRISNFRPNCPIIAVCDNLELSLLLRLTWGVYPYLIDDAGIMMEEAEQLAVEIGRKYKVPKGAPIILAGGTCKLSLSGAGKSVAISALEEQGFYYLDNFPVALIKEFLALITKNKERYSRVAISLEREQVETAIELCRNNYQIITKVIFLECSELELITRYKRTRRKHPLQLNNLSLLQAIREETKAAREIKLLADDIIDTTFLAENELRMIVLNKYSLCQFKNLQIGFISFGFKYGIPLDGDLILDVRFLINPYYVDQLKEKTGMNKEVYNYVMVHQNTKEYLKRTLEYLDYIFNMYILEGKSSVLIGIGCTGEDFHKIQVCFGQLPLVSRSDKSYFLAGVFVSCGSLNSPLSAEYHLELQLDNRDDEEKIIKIMQFFNLNPKQIIRRNKKILYLKKAVEISDFISIIHAEAKMLEYENFRIEKDFFLAATRVNNCDAANLQKVLKAGEKQLTAINKILPTLHGVKKRIAHLRIKYPERSLERKTEMLQKLRKEDINIIHPFLIKYPYHSANYNLITIYLWSIEFPTFYYIEDDVLYLFEEEGEELVALLPVTDKKHLTKSLKRLEEIFQILQKPFIVRWVPKALLADLDLKQYQIDAMDDLKEYIYLGRSDFKDVLALLDEWIHNEEELGPYIMNLKDFPYAPCLMSKWWK
ncbi:pyruvate kinase [Holotrichia oblita]|nr:pyruvate kinase [Holotrichia oblita]